ncbi:MAG: ribonuclease R [Clostridia bacterium]
MEFKEKLLQEIQSLQVDVFTDRLLCKRLNMFSTFEKTATKKALTELVSSGQLVMLQGGQYSLTARAEVYKGVLRGNRRGFAFLIREDGGADLFIPHRSLNGALHGDTVFARIVKGTVDEGEVVSVLSRGINQLVGKFVGERGVNGFVIPDDDSYFCDIYVPSSKRGGAKNDDMVVVKILNYKNGKNPDGEIIEVLGKADTVKGDTLAIIRAHGFFENFPMEVLNEAEKAAELVDSKEFGRRKDLTKLVTITIDGEDARDFDDAISIERVGSGYKLYVHIADVSHFVRQGSVLDNEALKRATSVYLPNLVLPMLPEAISNGVCSLVENEKRLTLTVIMTLDSNGKLTNQEFVESVISSNHRMTYTDVTKILDNDKALCEKYSDIIEMLKTMAELAKVLGKKRLERGSINFQSRESKIVLNSDDSVKSIERYPYALSNNIIEEFMLLANETVAEFMFHTDLPFVYRVHEVPSREKLEVFKQFVMAFGYNFILNQNVYPMQFQALLNELTGKPEEGIISKVMLRSMQKAKYTTQNLGHFGLAADYYCHFTSPIRRYPDLMIHRVIKAMLRGKLVGGAIPKFEVACERAAIVSSEREIASEQAERDADDYFKMLFMVDKVGNVYDGYISGVTSFGVFVELDNTVEGLIGIESLPKGKYEFLDKQYILKGVGRSFALGDKLTVKVESVNRDLRKVNFVLYEDK